MINAQCECESQSYTCPVYYRYFNKHSNLFNNKRLCLQKMMPELEENMCEFYDFSQKYPLIIKNYLTLYKFDAILEYQYLSAVYTVESFARYVHQDHNYFPNKEFQQKIVEPLYKYIDQNIICNNKDCIQRLKNAIKYSNEPSLRSIIKQLLNNNKDIISQIINDNLKTLTTNIVDTRNWYTHYSKEFEVKAKTGYELYNLFVKVRILFETCLFRKLHMSDEHIISTIKTTYLLDSRK